MSCNVLITSVSAKISCVKNVKAGLQRVFPEGKVWGADVDPTCLGRHFTDYFWHMPRLDDLTTEGLVRFCKENDINTIIPTRDGELLYFARCKNELLENGIHTMISCADCIEICLDKIKFSERMLELGYPAIRSYTSPEACPEDRLVQKNRFGAGSADIKINVSKTEITTQQEDAIYQPYIKGEEFSIDVFTAGSAMPEGAIVRRRDKVVNGESQITTAVDEPELAKLCLEASKEIGIYGHSVWQALKDEQGNYNIIECNSRIGGASSLSLAMGLDSFYWFFVQASGKKTADLKFTRHPENLKQIRAPKDVIQPANTCI